VVAAANKMVKFRGFLEIGIINIYFKFIIISTIFVKKSRGK
jgi:hypothetical protein